MVNSVGIYASQKSLTGSEVEVALSSRNGWSYVVIDALPVYCIYFCMKTYWHQKVAKQTG